MGEVYRARDTRLNRDVALEVLPDVFASDAERLARFEREAQTLAAVNHPNIAQIYVLEESPSTASPGPGQAGVRALVTELVEGKTLDEFLAGRPSRMLAVEDAPSGTNTTTARTNSTGTSSSGTMPAYAAGGVDGKLGRARPADGGSRRPRQSRPRARRLRYDAQMTLTLIRQ